MCDGPSRSEEMRKKGRDRLWEVFGYRDPTHKSFGHKKERIFYGEEIAVFGRRTSLKQDMTD